MLSNRLRRIVVRTDRLSELRKRFEIVSTVQYGEFTEATCVVQELHPRRFRRKGEAPTAEEGAPTAPDDPAPEPDAAA